MGIKERGIYEQTHAIASYSDQQRRGVFGSKIHVDAFNCDNIEMKRKEKKYGIFS